MFFCTFIEYGEGSFVSTQGDVYSLGILLLEMFTGRSPTDQMFSDSLDLHKFSENALPERIWEIVDPTIWMHIDANNRATRSRIRNCLVSVVALGISCSKKQPREWTQYKMQLLRCMLLEICILNLLDLIWCIMKSSSFRLLGYWRRSRCVFFASFGWLSTCQISLH